MPHIFVSTTFFGDNTSVYNALDLLEANQFRNIELGSNHKKETFIKKAILKKNNYIFHNYFPPKQKNFVLNIASLKPAIRQKSLEFIKKSIVLCSKLGIRYYTIHPGFTAEALSVHKNEGKTRNFDFVFAKSKVKKSDAAITTAKTIKNLYRFAKSKGVQLLIENQGSKTSPDDVLFSTIDDLRRLKNFVPDLSLNFNIAHAILADVNLKDSANIKFIFDNSSFFEVSEIDGVYDSHLPIMNTKGKVAYFLKREKMKFAKKNLILEYRNTNIDDLTKSAKFIQKLLNLSLSSNTEDLQVF